MKFTRPFESPNLLSCQVVHEGLFEKDGCRLLLQGHVGADDYSIVEESLLKSHLAQAGVFLLEIVETSSTDVGNHDVV